MPGPSPDRFGTQYAEDDPFKAAARRHQSRFRVESLGVSEFRDYGNRLPSSAAIAGMNFYPWPGLLDAVAERFGHSDKKLYWDMLRSEHIPFNFFIPLRDLAVTRSLISGWTGDPVKQIGKIIVEWAPEPSGEYLADNTSFDTYVEYERDDQTRGAVGVEVKYTERSYSWGQRERAQMSDPESAYHRVHGAADLYLSGAQTDLATRSLKQLWRNQLLGEAMVQRGLVSRFTSVLLYPRGNEYLARVSTRYSLQLKPAQRHRFMAVPYEQFIAQARALDPGDDGVRWLNYLEARYVVTG